MTIPVIDRSMRPLTGGHHRKHPTDARSVTGCGGTTLKTLFMRKLFRNFDLIWKQTQTDPGDWSAIVSVAHCWVRCDRTEWDTVFGVIGPCIIWGAALIESWSIYQAFKLGRASTKLIKLWLVYPVTAVIIMYIVCYESLAIRTLTIYTMFHLCLISDEAVRVHSPNGGPRRNIAGSAYVFSNGFIQYLLCSYFSHL